MSNRTTHPRAFTLTELLIVIAIIVVLVGLITPSVVRAKYESRLTVCAARQRTYVASMMSFASANNGVLPRYDLPGTGCNAQDLSFQWQTTLTNEHGMTFESFFCPESPVELTDTLWKSSGFFIGGYCVWVPRQLASRLVPPNLGDTVLIINGTEPIRGPVSTRDPLGATNPVVSDDIIIRSEHVPSPAGFDLAGQPMERFWSGYSAHFLHGRLKSSNAGFIDGRVERIDVGSIKLRYRSSNAWNCW